MCVKVRDACLRALDKAKPSTSYTVLEKREQKRHRLILEGYKSLCELETARADSMEAHFKAEMMRGFAKDATIRRLKACCNRVGLKCMTNRLFSDGIAVRRTVRRAGSRRCL